MNERIRREPGPDHPIAIEACTQRVVVSAGGRTLADTRRALQLREAGYPPVLYIARADVDMSLLEHSTHRSYCPFKGECSYYHILGAGERGRNALGSYENPYPAVAAIGAHLAFYPDRVDAIERGD